ncbi:unnamed protein product [Symbiodinium natans]|uniref:Uncharacterized protein n=1 Tax=Symbiodinium natans TaxID=878477 RepID=A0A812J3H9_9DINO|nr:unnamed protein product [Symbiodinium natans]
MKLKGLMKAALARSNELLANDALRLLSRLMRKRGLIMEPTAFKGISQRLLESALMMQCPDIDQVEAEALSAGSCWAHSLPAEKRPELLKRNEQLMAELVNRNLPQWLECRWAHDADAFRLRLALDCWDRRGCYEDVEGTGLYGAICMELGEPERARSRFEHLRERIDFRLAYQPGFLEDLLTMNLWSRAKSAKPPGDSSDLADLVQKAAQLAFRGASTGILRRRHGAVLFEGGDNGYKVVAEGFNHIAAPLPAERAAALAGAKARVTQRHAEVHCLLQLRRLADAKQKQMLIVEVADVGPGLGWAEPCSRGCVQLLTKYGLTPIFFTDGQGALVERQLQHDPDLDVPYKTYARRLSDDRISERAWLDISSKMEMEQVVN